MSLRKIILCPFCDKGEIHMFYSAPRTVRQVTRGSGKNGTTLIRTKERYQVLSDCPVCEKKAPEIEKAIKGVKNRPMKHQDMLDRLKKAGLPTRI